MPLTKSPIIEKTAKRLDLKRAWAEDTTGELLEIIKSTLADGDDE